MNNDRNHMTRSEYRKLAEPGAQPKRRKYGNVKKETSDGVEHDSQHEADVWSRLLLLQQGGHVRNLQKHVPFKLLVRNVQGQTVSVGRYESDFVFEERTVEKRPGGNVVVWTTVVADAKGMKTSVYNLKKRLMKAIHGIDIREY